MCCLAYFFEILRIYLDFKYVNFVFVKLIISDKKEKVYKKAKNRTIAVTIIAIPASQVNKTLSIFMCCFKHKAISPTRVAIAVAMILAVLESGSEIRMIIEQTQGGKVSDPEDYKTLEDNIRWFIDNAGSDVCAKMGRDGYEYMLRNLTRDVSVNRYIENISKL